MMFKSGLTSQRLSFFQRRPFGAVFGLVAFWAMLCGIFEYYFPIVLNENLDNIFLVGLITSLMSIFSLVTFIPFGYLAKKSTLHRLLALASFFFLIVCSLLFFVPYAPLLILIGAALIYGLFFDMFSMSVYNYIFHHVTGDTAPRKFALRDIFESAGFVIGYILVGFFLSMDFPWLLQLNLVLAVVLLSLIFIVLRQEKKPEVGGQFSLSWAHTKEVLSDFKKNYGLLILWLIAAQALVTFIFFTFAPIYFHNRAGNGIPGDLWGGLIFAATMIPFIFLAFPIAGKIKPVYLPMAIAMGLAMQGLGFIGFSLVQHYLWELLVMAGAFVGYAFYWPAAETFFMRCSLQSIPDNQSEDVGILNTALNIGCFLGSLAGGVALSFFSFPLVMQWAGFVLIALAIISFLFLRTPRIHCDGFLEDKNK